MACVVGWRKPAQKIEASARLGISWFLRYINAAATHSATIDTQEGPAKLYTTRQSSDTLGATLAPERRQYTYITWTICSVSGTAV